MTTSVQTRRVYEIAGIGFGPANLALAVAIAEQRAGHMGDDAGWTPEDAAEPYAERISAVFLERQPRFGWHRGMLIDDATMQVSFLKDLVTLRDPASRFSFLCYLHSRGRLVDFINHKTLFPLRVEYHDYLEWAASQVDGCVRYRQEVIDVVPVTGPDGIACFDVISQGPREATVVRARNLVFGTGLIPALPEGVRPGPRVWHSADLLTKLEALKTVPRRFVVVGAGQSAAEVTALLHERFPAAEIRAVFSRYGYSPADDSPFANRIFDPEAVDAFYGAPGQVKRMLLDYHRNTNYSVVDLDLINELYRRTYQEKVLGTPRLHLHNVSRLVEAGEYTGGVRTVIESLLTGEKLLLDTDILVCATGYRQADPTPLLGDLADDLSRDERGQLRLGRDYRVLTRSGRECGVYLQGGTEHTHGITSSLLSNSAVRAGEILRSVLRRRRERPTVPVLTAARG